MIQLKTAIFDFDGTLLDSMGIWATIASQYLKSLGVTPKPDVDETIFRMSLVDAANFLRREYHLEKTLSEIRSEVNQIVETSYFETLEVKPGVLEMLARFKRDGVRMCVATASDRYVVEAAMKRTGLADFIDTIFTCTELKTTKDEPLIYEKAMEQLGGEKESTVVFEDAAHAVQTAKEAGFTVVAIYDDTEKENQAYIRELADYYLISPAQWKTLYAPEKPAL